MPLCIRVRLAFRGSGFVFQKGSGPCLSRGVFLVSVSSVAVPTILAIVSIVTGCGVLATFRERSIKYRSHVASFEGVLVFVVCFSISRCYSIKCLCDLAKRASRTTSVRDHVVASANFVCGSVSPFE